MCVCSKNVTAQRTSIYYYTVYPKQVIYTIRFLQSAQLHIQELQQLCPEEEQEERCQHIRAVLTTNRLFVNTVRVCRPRSDVFVLCSLLLLKMRMKHKAHAQTGSRTRSAVCLCGILHPAVRVQ